MLIIIYFNRAKLSPCIFDPPCNFVTRANLTLRAFLSLVQFCPSVQFCLRAILSHHAILSTFPIKISIIIIFNYNFQLTISSPFMINIYYISNKNHKLNVVQDNYNHYLYQQLIMKQNNY